MESYLKIFMRDLLSHKQELNEYINQLYLDERKITQLNSMFGELKKEGLLNCTYADNRAYIVTLTPKGENISKAELKLSNKEELILLINKADDMKKLFHKSDGEFSFAEMIYDVPEFQEWIQQIILYLQEIFDRTHDQYVIGAINTCNQNMNGWNDRKSFNEIVGKLKGIEININSYYDDDEGSTEKMGSVEKIEKTPMIFISHSSKDKPHVELIVNFLKEMGFTQNDIFCSSIPGYGIKLNNDIFDTLRNLFTERNLYVMFVHSANYYNSAVSLNEMGAAWALKTSGCSILLPGFEYSEMKGVVDSRCIVIKIDHERAEVQGLLNDLKDELSSFFSKDCSTSVVWENDRNRFINQMNATEVVNDKGISQEALNVLVEAEKENSGIVLILRTVAGTIIKAGSKDMNRPGIRREEAKMEAAVIELVRRGYLQPTADKGEIYQLTNEAYEFIDTKKN